MELAKIMALSDFCMPYISQSKRPVVNKIYMPRERELVSLVFKVRIACGKKEAVVIKAAQNPNISVGLIFC